MTPSDFKATRTTLKLSQRALGILLGYSPKTAQTAVSKLEAGSQAITVPIAQMMKGLKEKAAERAFNNDASRLNVFLRDDQRSPFRLGMIGQWPNGPF